MSVEHRERNFVLAIEFDDNGLQDAPLAAIYRTDKAASG